MSTWLPARLEECLGCPFTKAPLKLDEESRRVISADAEVAWRVDEAGIPDLLPWSGAFLEDTEGGDGGAGDGDRRGDKGPRDKDSGSAAQKST